MPVGRNWSHGHFLSITLNFDASQLQTDTFALAALLMLSLDDQVIVPLDNNSSLYLISLSL